MTNPQDSHHNDELIKLLSNYFSKRGNFLAQVIKADLQKSPFLTAKGQANNRVNRVASASAILSELTTSHVVINSETATIITPEVLGNTSSSDEKLPDIEKILIDIVVEQTKYPRESINSAARLLDDLNLDSIKSAELVAQTAKQLGIEGQIDPSNFANATIAEVVEALQELIQSSNHQQRSPLAASTNHVNSRNPWVRNFIVEYVAEAGDKITQSEANSYLFSVDNWAVAQVLIVFEPEEVDVVETLQTQLQQRHAQVKTTNFVEVKKLISGTNFTHFIAVLPRTPKTDISIEIRIQTAMDRLRALATPPATQTSKYTSVSYLQFGGGYFGKQQQIGDIDQTCTLGFAASLHLERQDLKIRIIDLPATVAPSVFAEDVIDEISRPEAYLAVGYDSELTRRIPRPRVQDRSQYQNRNITWSSDDVFLITGGAKGITAECALALARTTGVRMALVGSSPHPQDSPSGKSSAEITRVLQRFSDEGLTCQYYQCDIANFKAVSALVEQIEKKLGKVTGVVHGAAVNKPRRVEQSTLEEACSEVKPKILGAINLTQVLKNRPPKLFVGFSSIGAVLGLPGNTWYSFSNEALDLILRRFGQEHPETSVVSIAYSVWSEVGMGARMGAVHGLAKMGIDAISPEQGVNRFVQLVTKDPGESQVVIAARLGSGNSGQPSFDTWLTKRFAPLQDFRFIELVQLHEPDVESVVRTHLTLENDSYVQHHIYKGSYLFPTVFGLEAMAQVVAFTLGLDGFKTVRMEDIRLERPIVVDPNHGVDIEIRAEVIERESAQEFQQVRVEIRTERTGFNIAHFAATFVLGDESEILADQIKLPATPLDIDPKQDLYGWLLFQGPRFQRIKQIYTLNSNQMVFLTEKNLSTAEYIKVSGDRANGPFLLGDPYYRDSLLHSVQPMVPQDLCLPIGIKSIQINPVDSNNYSSYIGVALRQATENQQHNTTVFTINDHGQVIEKLDGYQLKIMEHRQDNPTAEELVNPGERDEQLLHQQLIQRAKTLSVNLPEISLVHLPGLHNLSAEERHSLELPVFSKTVDKLMHTLEQ